MVNLPTPARGTAARALLGRWTVSALLELMSGPPLNAVLSGGTSDAHLGLFDGRQRPDLVGDPNTPGDDQERVSSADHPDARWFDAGAFGDPGIGRYGTAPRNIGSARYQFRKNLDLVITKTAALGGSRQGEIRFEILNATNTPKFGALDSNATDVSSFGRVSYQAGFMRIWQLSFRYRF